MNDLTNDELMTLISLIRNKLTNTEKVIDMFGLSDGRQAVWTDTNKLLRKLQTILEDRIGK